MRDITLAGGYLIDIENAVIVDVEATPARTYDEVAATRTMIERTEACFALKPKRLAADTAYGTGAFLGGRHLSPGDVASVLVDVAHDAAGRHVGTALRLERAGPAVAEAGVVANRVIGADAAGARR